MKKRLKNMVLKSVTFIAACMWVCSAMAFDSENYIIPLMLNIICGIWLSLFLYANQIYFWKWEHGDV